MAILRRTRQKFIRPAIQGMEKLRGSRFLSLKQFVKDHASKPVWEFLRKIYDVYRNCLAQILLLFPWILPFLPQKNQESALGGLWWHCLNFRKFLKIEQYKKFFPHTYQNALKFFVLSYWKPGGDCDAILLKNRQELTIFLASCPKDAIQIQVQKSPSGDEKIKVLHLVSWFMTEPCATSLVKHFLLFSDRKKFIPIIFSGTGFSEPVKSFFNAHSIEMIEGNVATKTSIDCDVILDWDGAAAANFLMLPSENRPLIVSFSNDFLPDGRSDYVVSFESTADVEHLDNAAQIRKKFWSLPDQAILEFTGASVSLPVNLLPVQKNDFISFGSFAHNFKITDLTLEIWSEILRSVPNSCLELCNPCYTHTSYRKWFLEKIAKRGISPQRITFSTLSGYPDYCQKFPAYDIILGACPYAGGRTSFHMAANGFFQLSLIKSDFVYTKLQKSLYLALGVPELVLETPEQYVKMAQTLAANPEKIIELRTKIKQAVTDYRANHAGEMTRLIEGFLLKAVQSTNHQFTEASSECSQYE